VPVYPTAVGHRCILAGPVVTGALVFFITYLLIAGRRLRFMPLDRPAGALVGAVLAVALGVLTPAQALAAVNGPTLLLLFGLMGIGAFLAEGGLLDSAAATLARRAGSPRRLLAGLVWGAGALSALVTNDAVCVLAAPVVVSWIQRYRLPPLPFLIGLATAANTGSVATLVGNPQNMLCATLGGLTYRSYSLRLLPVAVIALAINHLVVVWCFRRELREARLVPDDAGEAAAPPQASLINGKAVFTLMVLGGTVAAYLAGADLAWTAVAGFTALLIVHRADPAVFWGRIDWSVILFFGGLFVVVEALVRSGGAAWALDRVPLWTGSGATSDYLRTAGLFLIGSNVVSNVPFILVIAPEMARLPDPTLGWQLLAMASTFAGNLTLLGSVANIIVAERGRSVGGLPFLAYLRVGFPVAVLTTAVGAFWLLLLR
jgi:Na+/H+ antiporter NhaD/arsenite permease-like protein